MKRLNSIVLSAVAMFTILAVPLPALAASNSIGINPRRDYTIKPGDTIHGTLTVKDLDAKTPLNATIQVVDFKGKDQTGTPALLLNQQQPTKWSLKPFLKIQDQVTVAPGNNTEVPFTISIPANMGAGSFYSAVRFSTDGGGTNGNVGLSSSAVTLIFVRIPGKANDALLMQQFGTFVPTSDFTGGSFKTFFGSSKPKYISYSLKNTGNVAEQPIGSIQITNPLGKQYKIIPNINPNHNLILIGQTRRIDVCISEPAGTNQDNTDSSIEDISKCKEPSLMPGRYTAKIDLLYGDNGSASTEIRGTSTFWYLPAWFLIAVVIAVLIVVGVIWLIVRAIRNRGGNKFRSRR